MRSLALVFLCLCLAVSGTAAALPMVGMATGVTMEASMAASMEASTAATAEATAHRTSMTADCPDMAAVAAMPAAHGGVGSPDGKPDCCRTGGCPCAAAHGVFQAFSSPVLPHFAPQPTMLVEIGDSGYASPALARLIRPPIS